jgi:TDG/mug DNA glycosylase family protein
VRSTKRAPKSPSIPTRAQLEAARGGFVPDLIDSGLSVLFCGINPSLYSVAVQHHFARPGNRFWRTLHGAGFSERLLRPDEEQELLRSGLGITNLVSRGTARADELRLEEYDGGALVLTSKLAHYRPRYVAFLGVQAYRFAFKAPLAQVGPQRARLANSEVWVLPNPSGLNAHYQIEGLIREYAQLARAVALDPGGAGARPNCRPRAI